MPLPPSLTPEQRQAALEKAAVARRQRAAAASRRRREGEVGGRDYVSLDRDELERPRDAGGFVEWFEVYSDRKGPPRATVEEDLAAGDDVLLEVDVQGAIAVREAYPDAV